MRFNREVMFHRLRIISKTANVAKANVEKFREVSRHLRPGDISGSLPRWGLRGLEVVDLLAESGLNSCNEWLKLLEDTEINYITLERVVKHVRKCKNEVISVDDSTISSAKNLLPLIPPKEFYTNRHCPREAVPHARLHSRLPLRSSSTLLI
ncbi:hypothetical protein E2C01_044335 [Portunus trituberculatus]|uniref:Uncharacterized protein n=1 Tax=Portunus trituberculatus TaxID=210409 RepID=A0A5B7FY60_PORTR|nr:hypothetical protein [Portunus trituberculatus]